MKNKYLKVAKISEAKFRVIVDCFAEDIAATKAARLSRVNRHTAQRIYTLLRTRIVSLTLAENHPFSGEVEVDECYFGASRIRGKRGRGAGGKTPVIGLRKRDGKVFVEIVKDCSRKALLPVIKGQVIEESTVYTDDWSAYDSLVREGYKHLVLSDKNVSNKKAAIPMILAIGAVNSRLVDLGIRGFASINVQTSEVLDTHSFAVLLGVGATVINPYIAFDSIHQRKVQHVIQ